MILHMPLQKVFSQQQEQQEQLPFLRRMHHQSSLLPFPLPSADGMMFFCTTNSGFGARPSFQQIASMLGQMKRLMGKQQNAFRFLLPIGSRVKFIASYLFTEPRLQLGPPPLPPPYWLLYLLHSILYCGGGQRRRGGVSQRGRRGILFSPSKSPSRPSRGRTDGRPKDSVQPRRRRSSGGAAVMKSTLSA